MCYNELMDKLYSIDYTEILNRLGNDGVNSYIMNGLDTSVIKERTNVDNIEDFDIDNNHITLVTPIEDDGSKNDYILLKKSKLSDEIPSYVTCTIYLYDIHNDNISSMVVNDMDDTFYLKIIYHLQK